MQFKTSRFLRILLPCQLLILVVIGFYGQTEIERELTRRLSDEKLNVARGAAAVSGKLDDIARDLAYLSSYRPLHRALDQGDAASVHDLADAFVSFSLSKGIYDQLRWIDETGQERVRVDYRAGQAVIIAGDKLQNKGNRYYFTDADMLAPGEIFVSPLDLNIEQNQIEIPHKPMVRFATPVKDARGAKRGIVILNYFGRVLLDGFGSATADIGDHAMLLDGDGYWLKSPQKEDEWGFMFKATNLSLAARAPTAWRSIRAQDDGQLRLADGIWTWQTIYPLLLGQNAGTAGQEALVPSRSEADRRHYVWKSVAHLGPEQLAALRNAVWLRLGLIGTLLMGLAGWGCLLLGRALQQRAQAQQEILRINAGLEATVAERTHSLAESEEKHRLVLETMLDAVITTDDMGVVSGWNSGATGIFGWTASEALGRDITTLIIPAALHDAHRQGMRRYRDSGQPRVTGRHMELPARHKDGHELTVAFGVTRFMLNDTAHFSATLRDITEQKRAETLLRQAASVFEHSNEGITITDAAGTIIDVNAAFSRITGYARDEVLGSNPRVLKSGIHDDSFYASMFQALKETGHWSSEIWNRRKNGEVYPEMITVTAVKNAHGQIMSYVALFSDITLIKERQEALERIAHFDPLTGLPNRLLLSDRLRQAIVRSSRNKSNVALLYLDLDGFKAVNDNFGHASGDRLLIELARRMTGVLREGDTLARVGGDEFVAILPDLTSPESCLPIIDRLIVVANEPVADDGNLLRVSASIGVSFYPQAEAIDADQLVRQADHAMYQAKQSGKNRYQRFDVMSDTPA